MAIGNNQHGFRNEDEIINYINGIGRFDQLNDNFRNFLEFLYQRNLVSCTVEAQRTPPKSKADIILIIDNEKKGISVKMGNSNSVHQEPLIEFVQFLKQNMMTDQSLYILKEFHFADGTIDGSGDPSNRKPAKEWTKSNKSKTIEVNGELNRISVLEKTLIRILFEGTNLIADGVDAIYYGDKYSGIWASRDEILAFLLDCSSSCHLKDDRILLSNLSYQVWNRNLKCNPKTEKRRLDSQIKWPTLKVDIEAIAAKRKQGN